MSAKRHDHGEHEGHEDLFRRRFWGSLILSLPVLLYSPMLQSWLGYSAPELPLQASIGPLFALAVFGYGGLPFLRMAAGELRERAPGMMTLISLAIVVALAYSLFALTVPGEAGFFWELVTLIDVMLLGHWIEMRSVRKATGALDELAALLPDEAERLDAEGEVEQVAVSALQEDDRVLVRPGAAVPTDGQIVEGSSELDESMITGESRPVAKEAGDDVIAGTVNQGGGSLRVRVTATGDDTALAGIMRLVRDAQESKSDTQLLADRAAAMLFYVALAVAALTAVAWTLAIGFGVDVVARVATVLVIACPHALGLAVPLVVAITTAQGARAGILVRDRRALEAARTADVVLFDKTGTLTRGERGLSAMRVADDAARDQDALLALAAAAEGDSEHGLARAMREAAGDRQIQLPEAKEFTALAGRGVRASVGDQTVHVGGPALLQELEADLPQALATFAKEQSEQGRTVVHLLVDGQPRATFAIADVERPESKAAVERLTAMGFEVAMITGDAEPVARAVAQELGIERVMAEVLPADKSDAVARLQDEGHTVIMVGDGVNDAPALSRADVGMAIGAGTDVAIESAGIVLVDSDPGTVARTVELARASHRKMIQNLWWAAGYNIVALPLAAGVLAPVGILLGPAVGALLMSASTVIVAINAQLLRGLDLGT